MDQYTMEEMKYKNGYEKGLRDAVKHGRWEKHGKHDWRCSVCKTGVPYSFTGFRYCHNCGAKMDGDGDA